MLAHDMARAVGGKFLLRIEDIDGTRSRPHWEDKIYEDLAWLGVTWDAAPIRQSERLERYRDCLDQLWTRGLLYPCTCNRRDILASASAPQEGADPKYGPDGLVYRGTCRNRYPRDGERPDGVALRLDLAAALVTVEGTLTFSETGAGPRGETGSQTIALRAMTSGIGDIVLSRKDFLGSYHISVVVDDADQSISDVIRGADLFDATQIHCLLQHLLDFPTPNYHHHRLIRDETGKRLAKRDNARDITRYRDDGLSPDDIRALVGWDAAPANRLS